MGFCVGILKVGNRNFVLYDLNNYLTGVYCQLSMPEFINTIGTKKDKKIKCESYKNPN